MRHKNFIYNNLVGIRLLYRMFPKSIILYSVLQMLHGVSWVLQVMSVQYFFDGISENGGDILPLVVKILLLGAAYAFAQTMNGVANCYGQILNRKVIKETNKVLFRTIDRKDAIAFEYAEELDFCIHVLTVAAYGAIIAMLVYYVLAGIISVGAFAAVFAALREFYGFMDELISERLAIAIENMAMVKNYLAFIGEDSGEQEQIALPEKFEIRLKDVSFAYPQSGTEGEKFVLSDINLRIPWGQTVALVGENGSGKSTLCHIIAGLYSPTKGTVSYEGVQKGAGRIVRGISAVFQKFCRYSMSLGENIRISDAAGDKSADRLNRICDDVGVDPGWAGGMDGMLGREFGGTELSGGQWQRIAIARGIYRNNSLLILDEPTAAIDALEEKYLYEEFGRLSRNCTSIIVTHRLASAQIADRILVIKEGRIVQDGSHDELVAAEGEYKTMYELQRQWYQ